MSYTILSHLFPYMLSLAVFLECVLDVLVFTMSLTTVYPFARPLTNTLLHRRPTVPNLTSPCRPPLRAVVHACIHIHTHTHTRPTRFFSSAGRADNLLRSSPVFMSQ